MADDKKNDTPSTDPKPAAKSAAVKPPVLEGTARPADASAPGKTDDAKAAKPTSSAVPPKPTASPLPKPELNKPTPPKTAPAPAAAGSPWLAGLAGGVIGLGAAYGLAFFGFWPSQPVQAPPTDPRIAQVVTAFPEVSTATTQLQADATALSDRLAVLEAAQTAQPATEPVAADQTALAEELAALTQRVDTLANAAAQTTTVAPPAPGPDAATSATLSRLDEAVTALDAQAQTLSGRLDEADTRIDQFDKALAENRTADTGLARMPLILSGLETAFDAGRPYGTELSALAQALPDQKIPEALLAASATGLKRPDEVARDFADILPDMLAGRPASADGQWQDNAADWLRGIVALRPAGEVEGDSPDAIVARIEAAIARRDFVSAQQELTSLPAPMQTAAGAVAHDIAALAAAQSFLAQLRSTAMTGERAQ